MQVRGRHQIDDLKIRLVHDFNARLDFMNQFAGFSDALGDLFFGTRAGNNHFAIINGTIVQKGDSIDGAHVKEVLENEAVLETRAGEFRLKIEN